MGNSGFVLGDVFVNYLFEVVKIWVCLYLNVVFYFKLNGKFFVDVLIIYLCVGYWFKFI